MSMQIIENLRKINEAKIFWKTARTSLILSYIILKNGQTRFLKYIWLLFNIMHRKG